MNVMKLTPILSRVMSHLRSAYSLDARSLALFRILVASVVLIDLLARVRHAGSFYADAGAVPRRLAIPILSPDRWSILFVNGSAEFAGIVLWTGIIAGLAMLAGFRTRAATIILWIVVVSVQTRNNHLLSGADTLIRVSLFWAMFLPLGARWSVDSSYEDQGAGPGQSSVSSVATFGLVLQCACVYLFTAIQKSGDRWHDDGTAVYYALGARDLSNSFGDWIFRTAPQSIFPIFTFGTLILEYAIPMMLLLPLRSGWIRGVGVGLVILLQVGIGLTMSVGLFPAISIASVFAILPGGVWSYLENRVGSRSFMARIRESLPSLAPGHVPSTAIAPQPGETIQPSAQINMDTAPLTGFVSSGLFLRRPSTGAISNAACAVAVIVMLMWNISTVSSYQPPEPAKRIAVASGMYQNWSMFAPNPQASSVWFVFEGTLASGERVDVLTPIVEGDLTRREPVIRDQSDRVVITDKYWRKYFHAIYTRESDLLAFAGYACRSWNAENMGQERLVRLQLTRGSSLTLINGERAEPALIEVGSWDCN